eukprot:UN01458
MPSSGLKLFLLEEVSCCLIPAAVVACSCNYFVATNKMETVSTVMAGTFGSFVRYGAQLVNHDSAINKENKFQIVSTSIACSSTVILLLGTLKNFCNIDNNGAVISSLCVAGGFIRFCMNCYKNTWNAHLENKLIPYDADFMTSSWIGALIG